MGPRGAPPAGAELEDGGGQRAVKATRTPLDRYRAGMTMCPLQMLALPCASSTGAPASEPPLAAVKIQRFAELFFTESV